jgi:hypothetical protein
MSERNRPEAEQSDDQMQAIPKWARRYARNQTLPVLVFQAIFVAGSSAFAGLSLLAAWAHFHGHPMLAIAAMLTLVGFGVWWVWFSVFSADGLIQQVVWRLTRSTGTASLGAPAFSSQAPPTGPLVIFMLCVVASTLSAMMEWVPVRYVQPIAAVYVIPFMVYMGVTQWRTSSPFMVLWPALYAAHAVLILGGAPISRGFFFDIFFPTVGYGTIAALSGHIYSRFALRKLRALAATIEATEEVEG